MLKLDVVIIEYHCFDDVKEAITSVNEHLKSIDFKITVISNSEYDAVIQDKLKLEFSEVNIIFNDKNTGYAGGVNRALECINSNYMFILNPDGRILNDGMTVLLADMAADSSIAIMGPRVVDEHGEIQPSCRNFPKPYTFIFLRTFLNKFTFTKNEQYRYLIEDFDRKNPKEVDWVSGGAMLVNVDIVKKIGGMDERYFLYMEDVDWCRTLNLSGYRIKFHPALEVLHAGQHSSINNGLSSILVKTTRWHLTSLFKFFMKWGWLK